MNEHLSCSLAALMVLAPMTSIADARQSSPEQKRIERPGSGEQARKPGAAKARWKKGGRYNGKGAHVSNYPQYRLKTPPRGHRWVRGGNDFLLIATASGAIASVVAGRQASANR